MRKVQHALRIHTLLWLDFIYYWFNPHIATTLQVSYNQFQLNWTDSRLTYMWVSLHFQEFLKSPQAIPRSPIRKMNYKEIVAITKYHFFIKYWLLYLLNFYKIRFDFLSLIKWFHDPLMVYNFEYIFRKRFSKYCNNFWSDKNCIIVKSDLNRRALTTYHHLSWILFINYHKPPCSIYFILKNIFCGLEKRQSFFDFLSYKLCD